MRWARPGGAAASARVRLWGWCGERLEPGAGERDDRIDGRSDLVGCLRRRQVSAVPLERLEGGGEGRGGDLGAQVVWSAFEVLCDRGSEQILQLRETRPLMARQ